MTSPAQHDSLQLNHVYANKPLPSSEIKDELQSVRNILNTQKATTEKTGFEYGLVHFEILQGLV